MVEIRQVGRGDLAAIVEEPYSVTIDEPGDNLDRLTELYELHAFWQDDAGAVAIDENGLKGTLQLFRSAPCIHGYEIGYVVHDRREWGKGLASAGLKLLSARLFAERPQIMRLQLTIECSNTSSWKVAERCGFVREGILRSAGFGDEPPDTFIYSRVRSDLA
jgi:RimJ/RimL family protein N-acetyltransferase